ncbi:MAG: hypothetical protein FJ030_14540 [Chloroflexi bacterium]|nr:hypothetical protein [Chloroflexota bacterium]
MTPPRPKIQPRQRRRHRPPPRFCRTRLAPARGPPSPSPCNRGARPSSGWSCSRLGFCLATLAARL